MFMRNAQTYIINQAVKLVIIGMQRLKLALYNVKTLINILVQVQTKPVVVALHVMENIRLVYVQTDINGKTEVVQKFLPLVQELPQIVH